MKKIKSSDFLYKLLLYVLIIDSSLYNTVINTSFKEGFHKICLICAILFALLCIILKRYTIKYIILNVSVILFGLLSYCISGNTDIFISILLVVLAWNLKLDDILNDVFIIRLIVFVTVVSLAFLGILEKGTIANNSAEKGIMLGYGHANTFAGNAGILILLMFAINRYNLKIQHYVIAILSDITIFYFSRSRVCLLLISSLILILLISKSSNKFRKFIMNFSQFYLLLFLVFIFGMVLLRYKGINNGIINLVDKCMNGRILLASMNFKYYPITFLGQKVDISLIAADNSYYALDNGFAYILIHYGLLGFFLVVFVQQIAIIKTLQNNEIVLCVLCVLIVFWMAYEGMMISATSNFSLLFAVTIIKNGYKRKDEYIGE